MKKRILEILLSAILAANFSACSQPANNIPENKTEGSVESIVEKTTETEESNNELPNQNETVRDVPGIGKLRLCYHLYNSSMASVWRSDENKEYYVYINEWDAYRPMRGLSSSYYNWWDLNDHCVTIDNDATTIALIDQGSSYGEPTILAYHFSRSNELVELHAVPLNIKVTRDDLFFVNMHAPNHGYYFLLPRSFPHYGSDWPLIMFETTDGGKSWNQIATYTFYATARYVEIFKFISPQVGIISFRYNCTEDLCERTYLTVDGGLTWKKIPQLPYPFDLTPYTWYSDVVDLEQNEDRYDLTVEVRGTLVAPEGSDYIFPSGDTIIKFHFESKDLSSWTLTES